MDLLLEAKTGQTPVNSAAQADPLKISSEELLFERCSEDEYVLWYSTLGGKAYSQVLIDRALVAQGWIATASDEVQSSYIRHQPDSKISLFALVLFYEHAEGCSIIVEVI